MMFAENSSLSMRNYETFVNETLQILFFAFQRPSFLHLSSIPLEIEVGREEEEEEEETGDWIS